MQELVGWISEQQRAWESRLDRLEEHLASLQGSRLDDPKSMLDGDQLIATRYLDAEPALMWGSPPRSIWQRSGAAITPPSHRVSVVVDLRVGGTFELETCGADGSGRGTTVVVHQRRLLPELQTEQARVGLAGILQRLDVGDRLLECAGLRWPHLGALCWAKWGHIGHLAVPHGQLVEAEIGARLRKRWSGVTGPNWPWPARKSGAASHVHAGQTREWVACA